MRLNWEITNVNAGTQEGWDKAWKNLPLNDIYGGGSKPTVFVLCLSFCWKINSPLAKAFLHWVLSMFPWSSCRYWMWLLLPVKYFNLSINVGRIYAFYMPLMPFKRQRDGCGMCCFFPQSTMSECSLLYLKSRILPQVCLYRASNCMLSQSDTTCNQTRRK